MSLAVYDNVYPYLVLKAEEVYREMYGTHSRQMRATQGHRSKEYQDDLYAQGRTKPGKIVTWQPGGRSMHNYGLAIDSAFIGPDPYLEKYADKDKLWSYYGEITEKLGLKWGGRFKKIQGGVLMPNPDIPHFQVNTTLTIDQIKAIYETGGLPAVWSKMDEILGAKNA